MIIYVPTWLQVLQNFQSKIVTGCFKASSLLRSVERIRPDVYSYPLSSTNHFLHFYAAPPRIRMLYYTVAFTLHHNYSISTHVRGASDSTLTLYTAPWKLRFKCNKKNNNNNNNSIDCYCYYYMPPFPFSFTL